MTEKEAIMEWLAKTFPGCEFRLFYDEADPGDGWTDGWIVTIRR